MANLVRTAILLLALSLAFAGAAPAHAQRRVALVIGNGAYETLTDLSNPSADAGAVAAALAAHGFEVSAHYDLSRADFLDVLENFQRAADAAEVAVVYYAGHGLEIEGRNVLAPVDMEVSCEPKQARRSVEIRALFEALGGARNQIVLLDACREDPFPHCASRGTGGGGFRGLQRIAAQESSLLIANATTSGALAADGAPGAHSPFAGALLARFDTDAGVPFRDLLDRTARDVRTATGGAQVPEITTQGGAPDVCLSPACAGSGGGAGGGASTGGGDASAMAELRDMVEALGRGQDSAQAGPAADKAAYEDASAVGTCGAFRAFARAFPESFYAELANERAGQICEEPPAQQQAAIDPQPSLRGDDGGFIFPDSSDRRLTHDDLAGLSARELRIARNEIFARNGRHFNSADLTNHFSQFGWYQPHTWEPSLTDLETYNVDLIQAEETRR